MSERSRRRRLGPKALQTPRRHEGDVEDYTKAQKNERLGDHAITPELVRGAPGSPAKARIVPRQGPAAERIIHDLATVLWGEIRTLRDKQVENGGLDDKQRSALVKITDATTKLLREERRQNELDDWTRMSEADLLGMLGTDGLIDVLPDEVREELAARLAEGGAEDNDEEPSEDGEEDECRSSDSR